jgi:hypothetical protein
MKKTVLFLSFAGLALLCSCATSTVQEAFHSTDKSALIIKSIDARSSQVIAPTAMAAEDNGKILDRLKSYPKSQTAIIILENYGEPQVGPEFRDRTEGWFIGLRGFGFQHIVILKGNEGADPDGLHVLAEYY